MPNFELPISPGYVGDWGFVQAVREIRQNSLDAATENPAHEVLFHYNPDLMILSIGNKLSRLDPSSLVLGNSTKGSDERMIGQFGEGYKLALIVLLRLGKAITIYNSPNVWTPTIEHSSSFNTAVMNINVQKYRFKECPEHDLIFRINGVTAEEVEQIKASDLYFHEEQKFLSHTFGRILLDPQYAGQIFVKGLLISTIKGAHYGYDFLPAHIKIGRDRDLVDTGNVYWQTSSMWVNQPTAAELVKKMLSANAPDIQDLQYHIYSVPKETVRYISCDFYGKHGANAVPCPSEAAAKKARQLHGENVKTVIVSPQLMAILERSEEYQSFKGQSVVAKKPKDLLAKFFKHRDNFKPSQRADIEAILAMSTNWAWTK